MTVYTLKISLRGISPMIWRRVRLAGSTTIADFHQAIQLSMGWENDYLHCFHIYGKDYGIAYEGGMSFSDNPRRVCLDDFSFDSGDRFTYTYNFFEDWICDIRVEQIKRDVAHTGHLPHCLSGNRRQGFEKVDEYEALFCVLDTVAKIDDSTTVGEIRALIDNYEATRFNRTIINRAFSSAFSGVSEH